jgi:hypothetical protein
MKYKVLLFNSQGAEAVDTAGAFTFYTFAQADRFASGWIGESASYRAYLWDGISWTLYTP